MAKTHAQKIADCIVKQTDPELPWEVNRYGCRVMCLLALPQFVSGKCLSTTQINGLISRGKNTEGVILSKVFRDGKWVPVVMQGGGNEHFLINWAFEELGEKRRGRQVGWKPAHEETRDWQYMIAHWETGGRDGHFTLHDKRQELIYDPHDSTHVGYDIDMKRIVRKLFYATWRI